MLASADPKNQAKQFVFAIILLPPLALHLKMMDLDSEELTGLWSKEWKDLLNCHGDDFHKGPEWMKMYLCKFGRGNIIAWLEDMVATTTTQPMSLLLHFNYDDNDNDNNDNNNDNNNDDDDDD